MTDPTPPDHDPAELQRVARELRGGLQPLLLALAGEPVRPVRLTQGIGLDKSLASRLVKAVRADSEAEFLHHIPSPTGLRILLERARGQADASLLRDLEAGVRRFEALLDRLPGGRQALDARMGESSSAIREKREQMARQASFKAQSFLFGHYCETLTTALFVLPSAQPGRVDVIEVHRRIGLQRLTPTMAVPLLSVHAGPAATADEASRLRPLACDEPSARAEDYLQPDPAGEPLPTVQVMREDSAATFVFPAGEAARLPRRLTTAWRVLNAFALDTPEPWRILRNYMLHTPCHTLVRDLYLAEGLWPDARPLVGFYLPGPSGTPMVTVEPGQPHLRRLNLSARIEQRPEGPEAFALDESADQARALQAALARAGAADLRWRGWRCRMGYPVPLVEMQLALRFGGH